MGKGDRALSGLTQMLPGGDRTVCIHPLAVDVIGTFPTGNVLGPFPLKLRTDSPVREVGADESGHFYSI